MKILITNIASVTAISIVKILKKGKITDLYIWGTEAQKYGFNSGSMIIDHYIQVPEVSSDSYVQTIIDICKKYNIDVLIPILDEELYLFSKSNLQEHVKVMLPDIETIVFFRNKMLASIELNNMCPGISPPIYDDIYSVDCEKVIIRKKQSIGSQGIIIKDKEKLCCSDFNNYEYFVQKYIEGTEYTVDILADSYGNTKLIIPRKRLQIKNGVSTKAEIINDKEIIDFCSLIYGKYCIPGLSNVQFIRKDDRVYFIELNMRFAAMGIAGVLASYDYFSNYILYLTYNKNLGNLTSNMKKIKWGTIVCRYFEETVLMQ